MQKRLEKNSLNQIKYRVAQQARAMSEQEAQQQTNNGESKNNSQTNVVPSQNNQNFKPNP